MATEISERHEVTVDTGERTFVFVADSAAGRLTIEETEGGEPVCSLTVQDPSELSAFVEGLRRVLGRGATGRGDAPERGRTGGAPAPRSAGVLAAPGPASTEPGGGSAARSAAPPGDAEDRDAVVARARSRNPKAFSPWSADEERRLVDAFRDGASLDELARSHQRSRRAVEMRLKRLGALEEG